MNGSHRVHLSEADYIVEGVHEPLPLRTYKEPSQVDIQIARNVVAEIPDGAVLGLGVGGVPFTVAKMLAESDRKDLGCWTGTISDAFLAIHKAGKLTNARKEVDAGYSTWNLAMGSQELYDWLEDEPDRFYPGDVDHVHAPERMGQLSSFISINGGVQLDLMGTGERGVGGQQAAVRHRRADGLFGGGLPLQGGRGYICLNSSRRDKEGKLRSNIVPTIPGGSTISVPRTMIECVATEYGVAHLAGLSLGERAAAMASIAHPDFREELTRYARDNFR